MKDYDLIISSNDDIIKFTVKETSKLTKVRTPAIVLIIAFMVHKIVLTRDVLLAFTSVNVLSSEVTLGLQQAAKLFTGADILQLTILCILSILLFCRQDREDTMIVMKNIGVQLKCKSNWKFIAKSDKNIFIPLSNIIDLVIHEGFYGYGQVIYYMCVLTKNDSNKKDDMIKVVFSELLPRKELLVSVWKQSRQKLFENKRFFRRVPGQGLKLVE